MPKDCQGYFENKKINVDDIEYLDTSKVTDMSYMFTYSAFNSNSRDLSDCGANKGHKLSDETWNSMLTIHDRKKAGLDPIEIVFHKKHNIPNGWIEKMKERGYKIKLK